MERDLLDASFKSWRNTKDKCEIMETRDMRERALLRTRYDSREGHYDWQLMMQLHQKQVRIINIMLLYILVLLRLSAYDSITIEQVRICLVYFTFNTKLLLAINETTTSETS